MEFFFPDFVLYNIYYFFLTKRKEVKMKPKKKLYLTINISVSSKTKDIPKEVLKKIDKLLIDNFGNIYDYDEEENRNRRKNCEITLIAKWPGNNFLLPYKREF